MGQSSFPIQKKPFIWTNLEELERAYFPEFLENFGERQILWSLCSVVFHASTLRLPIQTPLSVAPKLSVSLRSGKKMSKRSGKQAHP